MTPPTGDGPAASDGRPRPSDEEIRHIAKRLLHESDARRPASPSDLLSHPSHELAPADEERVEDALVEMGAVDPEATTRAERKPGGAEGEAQGS